MHLIRNDLGKIRLTKRGWGGEAQGIVLFLSPFIISQIYSHSWINSRGQTFPGYWCGKYGKMHYLYVSFSVWSANVVTLVGKCVVCQIGSLSVRATAAVLLEVQSPGYRQQLLCSAVVFTQLSNISHLFYKPCNKPHLHSAMSWLLKAWCIACRVQLITACVPQLIWYRSEEHLS